MMPASNDSLEKLQRADHDVLIAIKTTLDNFVTEGKLQRDDWLSKFNDHETRLRKVETVIEVNKGQEVTTKNNRRTTFEILGLVASILLIYVTWILGHHQ